MSDVGDEWNFRIFVGQFYFHFQIIFGILGGLGKLVLHLQPADSADLRW